MTVPTAADAPEAADLRGLDTFVFDLDNTLYPPDAGVLEQVEAKILGYFMRLTGLPAPEAWALQKQYFDAHGSAVPGLVLHHEVDPADFLAEAHDVPLDALLPDPLLRAGLERLPGRRLIFTNGSARHAERVLERLEIEDLFAAVFHVEAAELVSKPDPRAFARLIAAHGVDPAATAFFEDRAANLAPAADLGMTTVLVGLGAEGSTEPFVHHKTERLAPFLLRARVDERGAIERARRP